jgi:hypothetical protein
LTLSIYPIGIVAALQGFINQSLSSLRKNMEDMKQANIGVDVPPRVLTHLFMQWDD